MSANGDGNELKLNEQNFQALVRLVAITKQTVEKHEAALFGSSKSNGLIQIGEETRKGALAMHRQYLNDRAWVLRQAKAYAPAAKRVAYAVLAVLLLNAAGLILAVWRLGGR